MRFHRANLLILALVCCICVQAQDSTANHAISKKYIDQISQKSAHLRVELECKTSIALGDLAEEEAILAKRVLKIDPAKARDVFGNVAERASSLNQRLLNGSASAYLPELDSISTSLSFLKSTPQFLHSSSNALQDKVDLALKNTESLKVQLRQAEQLKVYLKERQQYLQDQLGNLGLSKDLKRLNKQAYYYSEQLKEYKELIKDHKKAERKALELLSKNKLFKEFFRKHSELASLFRMPGDLNDPAAQTSLAGLQTRVQVGSLIQQQIGSNGSAGMAQFQNNVNNAQTQLKGLKDKVLKAGGGSSEDILPEGFKPNDQKVKRLLDRLEFGSNIQSQKNNGYLPTSSDLGLSLGYRLNDRSVVGIGASYRVGWGKDIRHMNITHQGVGVRSFLEYRLKGSLWLSGGYEMNYRSAFNHLEELKNRSAWQSSGLIGISKVVSVKAKVLKKTKVQLLWDFLSYQQTPVTSPLIFRIGYTF